MTRRALPLVALVALTVLALGWSVLLVVNAPRPGLGVVRPPVAGPLTAPPSKLSSGQPSGLPSDVPTLACAPQWRRLVVVTLNIHSGFGHGRLDLPAIAEELAAWRTDVVALQEVERGRRRTHEVDQAAWLAQRLGFHVAYGPAMAKGGGTLGNAVLSRHPIVGWRSRPLPTRKPGVQPRAVLETLLDVDGVRVRVDVTHLHHNSSASRIAAMRDLARPTGVPRVLLADLNAVPDSPALAIARRRFADAWSAVGEGPGLTVPAGRPRRRVDYVLYDGPFTARAAYVLHSRVADHRAVWATLDLLPACPRARIAR